MHSDVEVRASSEPVQKEIPNSIILFYVFPPISSFNREQPSQEQR